MENTYNDKPKFDPNKPFQEVKEKPAFDPNQRFEVVDDIPKKKETSGIGAKVGSLFGQALVSETPSTLKNKTPVTPYDKEHDVIKNNLSEFNKRLKGETVYRQTPEGWKWDTVDFADQDLDKRNTLGDDQFEVGDIVKDNNARLSPTGYRQLQKIGDKYVWSHVEKPFLDEKTLPNFEVKAAKTKTDVVTLKQHFEKGDKAQKSFVASVGATDNNGLVADYLYKNKKVADELSNLVKEHPDQLTTEDGKFNLLRGAIAKTYRMEENPFGDGKINEDEFVYNMKAANAFDKKTATQDEAKRLAEYFSRPDVADALNLTMLQGKGETEMNSAYSLFPKYRERINETEERRNAESDSISSLRSLAGGVLDFVEGLAYVGAKVAPNQIPSEQLNMLHDKYKMWKNAKFTTPERKGGGFGNELANITDMALTQLPQMFATAKLAKVTRLLEGLPIGASAYADGVNSALSQGYGNAAANIKGLTDAATEVMSERLFNDAGMFKTFQPSKGLIALGLKENFSDKFKTQLAKEASSFVGKMFKSREIPEEIAKQVSEEYLSNYAKPLENKVYNYITGSKFDESLPTIAQNLRTAGSIALITAGLKTASAKSSQAGIKQYGEELVKRAAAGEIELAKGVFNALRNDPDFNFETIAPLEKEIMEMAGEPIPERQPKIETENIAAAPIEELVPPDVPQETTPSAEESSTPTPIGEEVGENDVPSSSNVASSVASHTSGVGNSVGNDVADSLNKAAGVEVYKAASPIELGGEKFMLAQLNENNNDRTFVIENEKGEEIGKAQLSADGNYLENIRIDEKYRRKGLASKLYDFIELRKGIELQPSPVKQSEPAKKLWEKRSLQKSVSRNVNGGLLAKAFKDAFQQTFGEPAGQQPEIKTTTNEQQPITGNANREEAEPTTDNGDAKIQDTGAIANDTERVRNGEDSGGEGTGAPPSGGSVATAEDGDGKKELDKLANNVPDSGKVAEYMSKDTIEKYTGETPSNDQRRGVQELQIALDHGEKIIEKAKELFGKDYAEKTLEYIDQSAAGVSNKALMYVSLENALGREKVADPKRAGELTKLQALVYEKSQAFARENSLALNYQKLRRIAKVGYDISKVTDSFFSSEELADRSELNKAIEANPDTINKEAEAQEVGGMTPDIEKLVQEGVEKEITRIYESLPQIKRSVADKAIKALEAVQKKLRGRTYDATLGIPVAIIDAGITTIKHAIKLGVSIADAVEAGIKRIKELYGKEWANEDVFRKDALAEFEKQIPNTKKIVKEALIEKGFGREINVKGEKKNVLDWKKLAGAAGTVGKIEENVEAALSDKGMKPEEILAMKKDLTEEYINLRASVIEKAQAELARRNKEIIAPEQKSAAKKLAELYTYGLFEEKEVEFENTLNRALGAKVSEQGYKDAKAIAKALESIYASTFKGVTVNDVSAKAAIEKLEDQLRILLYREAKKQGNFALKAATFVRNYFEVQQTMILNNLKQAIENPFSGLGQSWIDKMEGVFSKNSTPALAAQRRKYMKDIYKDMLLHGGIGFGKVEATFVNRQHVDDFVNKLSDSKLYHGIASVVTGKATLNGMDAMFKAGLTEKKFTTNLIKILTHPTNPKKMSKEDAVRFVSEKLTGQTFKDAQVTAKEMIDHINKEAGSELISSNQNQVDRLAGDIVKAALEMGGKITREQITAAYNAAYKSAGLGLGHEANNILSSTIKGYSEQIEGDINKAIKEKEWNRAAMLTLKSVLFRNILNPFIGGGTNWLVLKFEKAGLGLFTGLGYQIGSSTKLDLSTDLGLKRLEKRLYNQARIKDNYMRGLIGGGVSLLTAAAFIGFVDEDEYRKWRGRNQWAARYLDIIAPEILLAKMAVENKAVKKYISNSFNRNDAFDATNKVIKSAEYSIKEQPDKAWGALGEAAGSKLNLPLPWRLVKDGQVIYQGIKGEDPYHGNYKASSGFLNGVFQGGAIEWLGARPKPEIIDSPKKATTSSKRETPKRNIRKIRE